jgi:hypothetical protein
MHSNSRRVTYRGFLAFGLGLAIAGLQPAAADEPAAPVPGAAHAELGYFVGTWSTVGEFKTGIFGPAGKMTATETCEWFDGRFSIVCRADSQFPTGPNRSIGLLGYSTEDGKYTYYGADSSGMAMTTVSRGTLQGDTWTWQDESTMGGRQQRTRVTMKVLSPTSYDFRLEAEGADGAWSPVIESRATKLGQ